jgi:hypothetical protein
MRRRSDRVRVANQIDPELGATVQGGQQLSQHRLGTVLEAGFVRIEVYVHLDAALSAKRLGNRRLNGAAARICCRAG